jgi:hypothetical protein
LHISDFCRTFAATKKEYLQEGKRYNNQGGKHHNNQGEKRYNNQEGKHHNNQGENAIIREENAIIIKEKTL